MVEQTAFQQQVADETAEEIDAAAALGQAALEKADALEAMIDGLRGTINKQEEQQAEMSARLGDVQDALTSAEQKSEAHELAIENMKNMQNTQGELLNGNKNAIAENAKQMAAQAHDIA